MGSLPEVTTNIVLQGHPRYDLGLSVLRKQTFDADVRQERFNRISWHMLGRVSTMDSSSFSYARHDLERASVYAPPPFADVLEYYLWNDMFEDFFSAHMSPEFRRMQPDVSAAALARVRDVAFIETGDGTAPSTRGYFLVQNYAAHGVRLYYAAGRAGMPADQLAFLDFYAVRVVDEVYQSGVLHTFAAPAPDTPPHMARFWSAYLRGLYERDEATRALIGPLLAPHCAPGRAALDDSLLLVHYLLRAALEADDHVFLRDVLVPALHIQVPIHLLRGENLGDSKEIDTSNAYCAPTTRIGPQCIDFLLHAASIDDAELGIIGRYLDHETAAVFTLAIARFAGAQPECLPLLIAGFECRPMTRLLADVVASWLQVIAGSLPTDELVSIRGWAAHSFCYHWMERTFSAFDLPSTQDMRANYNWRGFPWKRWSLQPSDTIVVTGKQLLAGLSDPDYNEFYFNAALPFAKGTRIIATEKEWHTIISLVTRFRFPDDSVLHGALIQKKRFLVCALECIPPTSDYDSIAESVLKAIQVLNLNIVVLDHTECKIVAALHSRDSKHMFYDYVLVPHKRVPDVDLEFSPLLSNFDFSKCLWYFVRFARDNDEDQYILLKHLMDIILAVANGKLFEFVHDIDMQGVVMRDFDTELREQLDFVAKHYDYYNTPTTRQLRDTSLTLLETFQPGGAPPPAPAPQGDEDEDEAMDI